MTEQLFQFIWQHRYYNAQQLKTTDGLEVRVIHPGRLNRDQGPDFLNARIRIGPAIWVGSVELHLRTSDWFLHRHEQDEHYQNVILHVVYEHDRPHGLPLLELQDRIAKPLLARYEQLMSARAFIPCSGLLEQIPPLLWQAWRDRLVIERLERRCKTAGEMLQANQGNWLECFWWMLARQFGMKVNGDAFESLARSIPYAIIIRHRAQPLQIEALLFGQAGLLRRRLEDEHYQLLHKEYTFLQRKYKLTPSADMMRFSRMRPVNFPTVRLAQLATLVAQSPFLLHRAMEVLTCREALELIRAEPHPYWNRHYRAGKTSAYLPKPLGIDMRVLVMVNAVIPLLYAYAAARKNALRQERVINWLHELPAEDNRIIRLFRKTGLPLSTVACSQAGLELKSNYCDLHRCLECAMGNHILGRGSHHTPAFLVMMVGGLGGSDGTGTGSKDHNEDGESQEFSQHRV